MSFDEITVRHIEADLDAVSTSLKSVAESLSQVVEILGEIADNTKGEA